MTQRERTLATFVGGAAVLGGGALGLFLFFGAVQANKKSVEDLQKQVEDAEAKVLKVRRDGQLLDRWRRMGLTGDVDSARAKYKEWLSNLIRAHGLNIVTFPKEQDAKSAITHPTKPGKLPIYTSFNYSVRMTGSLTSLVSFIQDFQKAQIMHRIKSLTAERPSTKGESEQLGIQATFEALSILEVDPGQKKAGGPDLKYLLLDVFAAQEQVPTGLGLLRWYTANPNAPLNPPFTTVRNYADIPKRNFFLGPQSQVVTAKKKDDIFGKAPPDEMVNMMRFNRFVSLTYDGERQEAQLWDALWDKKTRLRTTPGFNRFPLVQTVDTAKIIQGVVVKIEGNDIIYRVTLQSSDPSSYSSKWWRYPDLDNFYTLHADDLAALVTAGKVREADKSQLYLATQSYWEKLTKKGEGKLEVITGGKEFRVFADASIGEILVNDKDVVVVRLPNWPPGGNPAPPSAAYGRFYPDKGLIYNIQTKHFNDLVADKSLTGSKKVKANEIDRTFVINADYWDSLRIQRIVWPEGNSFTFYNDLLAGDIIVRNDDVVVFRMSEQYCHCRGDKDMGIKDRWHEGFCVLHIDRMVQESLMEPLPANRVREFLPKTAVTAKD